MSPRQDEFAEQDLVLVPRPRFLNWIPKKGDWVRLRSGGPAMQVYSLSNDETLVMCQWRTKDGRHDTAFYLECLEPLDLLVA